jgi:hypothetical protein
MKKKKTVTGLILVGFAVLNTVGCGKQAPPPPKETNTEISSQVHEPTPVPTEATVELKASGSTGLLGVPLPEGAILKSSFPGDRAAMQDPREVYEIEATDDQLRSFFKREMTLNGWVLGPNSSDYLLIFEKNQKMLGVTIDKQKDIFMLMGS